jgi:hypothetical protein
VLRFFEKVIIYDNLIIGRRDDDSAAGLVNVNH